MDLSHICEIIGHFLFQQKGQLGHGLTRIKKKVCFAFDEKGHIAGRQLRMSGHGSAAWRFVLICGYLCNSACPVAPADLSAFGGWYWGVPKPSQNKVSNSLAVLDR